MSGTMVAANGGPSFAQQGSVDWVAISNSSVQFSVAVLARLSRAGIDAFTLQFGRAICSSFSLEPHAQGRINDAIMKLKKYGSYQDIIWFGFGIKDVVTDLADTEEGLTLVALCAALVATYDSMYAATVIRELCVLCKAPQSFTPAIRQWKALVDLCSGMFANAHFTLMANGFRRLISGHSNHLIGRHTPTTPTALAEAILMLAKVSKGNLLNATFSGGVDCAWLAAFAEWILSLDVAICDPSSSLLYRSRGVMNRPPQVTIIVPNIAENALQEVLIRSKATVIPSGRILLQRDPALGGVKLLNWHGSWSTILHEVFNGNIDDLLAGETGQHFNTYLNCISLLPLHIAAGQRVARHTRKTRPYFGDHPVNPLIWTQNDSKGQAFIKFAARRLPEIAACLLTANATWNGPTGFVEDLGLLAIRSIESVCRCAYHSGNTEEKLEEEDPVCLQTMAETIAIFLWILLDSDIDEDVLPSINGLANLFTWQSQANDSSILESTEFYERIMNCDLPVLGIDLVFHVLSGLAIPGTPPKHKSLPTNDHLARVGNGICVYHCAVEDPNLPLENMFRVRVVRGYISFSGFRFKEICGVKDVNEDSSLKSCNLRGEAPIRAVQTIVRETENETQLEMAYLVHYLTETAQLAMHWLHLPFIFQKLQRITTYLDCAGNCPPRYGIIREEYDRAQEMLSGFKYANNTWIMVNSHELFTIITGQPILLYALINQSSSGLVSFNDCLSCVMCIGTHSRVYQITINKVVDSFGRESLTESECITAKIESLNPFSETIVSLRGPRSERDE
ncbi:hypothetical protein JMJ35_005110 [Cladonia borealis]|uniref:Uncharacterized protein n=1 Tax=Cladonia borealis TaxID=184061 RepID=A0AA39QZ81_9LECA|nr:hypothetical protein JMJ35_005110 [Cladonia borealis]